MRFRHPAFVCPLVACCLAVACLPGCGKKQRATIKGKIVFNNQPLKGGTIAFVDANGRSGSSRINTDGTYTVNDAPVGEVTITVFTPPPSRSPMGQGAPAHKGMPKEFLPAGHQEDKEAGWGLPAPEKYSKVESSPLKYTVQSGSHDYDIDLPP